MELVTLDPHRDQVGKDRFIIINIIIITKD